MKRSRDRIMLEILQICAEKPSSKTRIVYQVNLNFHTVKRHLAGLMNMGLLDQSKDGPHPLYQITSKGQDALEHMAALNSLMVPE